MVTTSFPVPIGQKDEILQTRLQSHVITAFKIISTHFTALHGHYFQYTLLADFLSLSDTFDEHSLLRHHESEPSAASKETSVNRSRIMNNTSYAPLEYVSHHLSA